MEEGVYIERGAGFVCGCVRVFICILIAGFLVE